MNMMWSRISEAWELLEQLSVISRALTSLYAIRMGVRDMRLLHDIEKCRGILEQALKDLDLYGDKENIKNHLLNALQGLDKLDKMRKHGIDMTALEDKNILELENVLRRLSDALQRKVDLLLAGEIGYA